MIILYDPTFRLTIIILIAKSDWEKPLKKRTSSIFPLNLEEKEQTNKKSRNNDHGKICQALNGSFDSDSEAESSSDSSRSTEINVENDSF